MKAVYIKTRIYVIIQSNKGWSEPFAIFFHERNAKEKLAELLAIPKTTRNNFRLETWDAEDKIIYTTDDER